MENVEKILDNFLVEGCSFEEFRNQNKMVEDITKEISVRGKDITFLSLCELEDRSVEGKTLFYVLSDEYIKDFLERGKPLRIGTIPNENIGEELLEEMKRTTGLLAVIGNDKYLVSDIAIPTLSCRASVKGDLSINRQNLIRNLHFADAIISKNAKIHFVYREIEQEKPSGEKFVTRKILAALGSEYCMVPQTIITKVADLIADESILGKMDVRQWCIDHKFTEICIEFPETAEEFKSAYKLPDPIIPGVYLATSDVGLSSIIARGIYRNGKSYVITDEVMIKHVGNVKEENVVEKINNEIFPNIRKLPETLASLIEKEVTDYSSLDLSNEKDAAKNYDAVVRVFEDTGKKIFKGVLPAKRLKALLSCIADEINSSIHYTLYDVAVEFMGVPERVEGLDKVTLTELRKACAKAPFVLAKSPKKEDKDDIFLLPS